MNTQDRVRRLVDENDLSERAAALVVSQSPRLFAIVIEHEDGNAPEIAGWGIALAEDAHMVSANGRSYYALAEAENALNYVRSAPGVTQHFVWVA
ncbi:hypothetical protein [Kibdelosporangium phytohabitans]|uniref:Uncharacterized protein n=1 Tax=Kibdelosporangium phytohabitans TaxID=860235 RepID=A0A0N9ICC3_9PSEU|nr:hypothetical protein [Kibdelosporangium phytohabitans]ALG12876.1 hypothetical protein AOZ06_43875 [Kibdelosporangium phytohabitans]MBE1464578.1 hypothetical protein [Kibdelosporangium phytohabitans]